MKYLAERFIIKYFTPEQIALLANAYNPQGTVVHPMSSFDSILTAKFGSVSEIVKACIEGGYRKNDNFFYITDTNRVKTFYDLTSRDCNLEPLNLAEFLLSCRGVVDGNVLVTQEQLFDFLIKEEFSENAYGITEEEARNAIDPNAVFLDDVDSDDILTAIQIVAQTKKIGNG